ncbi:MAG: PEP-CTERM sorting domain-containing protein [Betaproteobacteria bacterium]
MNLKKLVVATIAACSLGLAVGEASAHAVSIGYENAGANAVTIWLGTYNHGTPTNEGSLTLEGVLGTVFGPTTTGFNLLVGSGPSFKPAGLVDGVTNWYAPDLFTSNPLVGTEAGFNAACPGCGPVDHWQGVTFTGLSAGDYQFTWVPDPTPSQEWSPLNTNMNGVFNLSQAVVTGVPEPTTLGLFGLGLMGLGFVRRRKAA